MAAGTELRYLPAYSPDFRPIELAFSKLKAILRVAAERTWTDFALQPQRARLLQAIDCENYVAGAGYDAICKETLQVALAAGLVLVLSLVIRPT